MDSLLLACSTALMLGGLHALEADHMAAVTSFAVRRPGAREAVRFGVRWSLGHGGAILIVGALLLVMGVQVPAAAGHWLERVVGIVMVGLGLWTFRGAAALHAHEHVHSDGTAHTHVHSHTVSRNHDHGHVATAVGLAHGLAGSGAAVALIPLVGFESIGSGMLYLLMFAIGTLAGMALYGLIAGFIVGRSAQSSARLARSIARATGAFTIVIGLIWMVR